MATLRLIWLLNAYSASNNFRHWKGLVCFWKCKCALYLHAWMMDTLKTNINRDERISQNQYEISSITETASRSAQILCIGCRGVLSRTTIFPCSYAMEMANKRWDESPALDRRAALVENGMDGFSVCMFVWVPRRGPPTRDEARGEMLHQRHDVKNIILIYW